MKTFTGSGFTQDSLTLLPVSPQGVNMPVQVDSLRERLNEGVIFANRILNQLKGVY